MVQRHGRIYPTLSSERPTIFMADHQSNRDGGSQPDRAASDRRWYNRFGARHQNLGNQHSGSAAPMRGRRSSASHEGQGELPVTMSGAPGERGTGAKGRV